MPDPELKPCPRCNSECYHQREGNCGMWRVMCRICHLHDPKWRATKAEATAWWNDRPAEQPRHTPEQLASLVEKVREAWTPEQAKDERAQCIGNGTEGNGCGNVAGKSGDTCPKCGGMMLSRQALEQAKDEPAQPKRTCGNCGRLPTCAAPNARDTRDEAVETPCDATCCGSWYSDDDPALPRRQLKDEPTHAAEDWPPKQHECPYWDCGKNGWLCERCREDRADRRTRAIVRAISRNSISDPDFEDLKKDGLL